jgi:hypothetical protein
MRCLDGLPITVSLFIILTFVGQVHRTGDLRVPKRRKDACRKQARQGLCIPYTDSSY